MRCIIPHGIITFPNRGAPLLRHANADAVVARKRPPVLAAPRAKEREQGKGCLCKKKKKDKGEKCGAHHRKSKSPRLPASFNPRSIPPSLHLSLRQPGYFGHATFSAHDMTP